jgi:hypothetical protein
MHHRYLHLLLLRLRIRPLRYHNFLLCLPSP